MKIVTTLDCLLTSHQNCVIRLLRAYVDTFGFTSIKVLELPSFKKKKTFLHLSKHYLWIIMQMQNVGHIQTKLTPKRSRVCILQEILEIAIDIKQIDKN